MATPSSAPHRTYAERAKTHKHPLAKQFLQLVERKRSNLCLSIDVTRSEDMLRIVRAAGPYVCMVKVRELRLCPHACLKIENPRRLI